MLRRLSICLVLSVFAIGIASAQVGIQTAAQNSWLVSGSGSMTYVLSSESGEDSEEGSLSLSLIPRVL